MKIKIVFIEPPYGELKDTNTLDQDIVIYIKDPYKITMVNGGRVIVGLDNYTITYEQYCVELKKIINNTLTSQLTEIKACDAITIEACKEPPNFKALNSALANSKLLFASQCNITYKDCSFSGPLYVNSTINLVQSAKKNGQDVFFNITIDESLKKSKLSEHDKAKLATVLNVSFFPVPKGSAVVRPFIDDQLLKSNEKLGQRIEQKTKAKYDDALDTEKSSRLTNPTYFYRANTSNRSSPRTLLLNFFSQQHQQQSDYTCGPACLKMIAEYYTSLKKRVFCGESITQGVWDVLNLGTEIELAESVKTTEAAGSDIADMRKSLMALGLSVIDDCDGLNVDQNDDKALSEHKKLLWEKIIDVLNLGIPIIINLRSYDDIGHYEVAIGIDNEENIIFADPGRALDGKVEFETIPKAKFIDRWKNMSGKFHGRFLILPPNEASAKKVESIFHDVPHYFNGEAKSTGKDLSFK